MANPQTKTIKRLFAVASNLCAFPKCSNSIVDAVSGKITGKICHIKGNRPGSKRFDPNQNDEERHGFQNLILLCPIHHDVIDDDEIAYTVQRLQAMKVAHEQSAAQATSELSDDAARQLVLNLENTSIQDGSILVSTNQIGGQIAHSIVNVGPRPRSIDENSRLAIAKRLYRSHPMITR